MLKKYLITFFISMVPLIELRAAIPYSQVVGLPLLQSYIICIIGNMLPVPIIFFFARKVLEWGCEKPVQAEVCRRIYVLFGKRTQRRRKIKSNCRKRSFLGTFDLCRDSVTRNRRMDRNTCSKHPGHGL